MSRTLLGTFRTGRHAATVARSLHRAMRRVLRAFGARLECEDILWHDIRRLLRDSTPRLCVDVGAYAGAFFTAWLRAFPGSEVIAFEPCRARFSILHDSHARSPNVRVECLALGDSPGVAPLRIYPDQNLSSMLPMAQTPDNPFREAAPAATEEVVVTTLDSYCADHRVVNISCLKVDTQGFDFRVLLGARSLLSRKAARVVMVELNFVQMYYGQGSAGAIIDYLGEHGYYPYGLYNLRRVPRLRGLGARPRRWYETVGVPYPDASLAPVAWCDAIFVPNVDQDLP